MVRGARRLLSLCLLLCASLPAGLEAQAQRRASTSGDSVTVVPGAHYTAGPLYRAFMGDGHRDLWTRPIRVPVADMTSLGGGLTPVRLGGGTTTRTLHLDGADGRRYVFRSVDKEPVDLIGEFVGTPIESILRDQMSSFHPSGAVVVAELLEAVGVLHVTARLVVVPDDPALGAFRNEFAGMLALFEERPDDPPEGGAGFAGSTEVVQTDRLFDILEDDPRSRVAARELLAARLVDLLVGDRDRSANNHLWARFDDGRAGTLWRPIPRDRDQAFVQLDGLLKGLARSYEPRLVTFGDEFPSVEGLTRNAWDIDRNLLVGLSRDEWTEAVEDVQRRITDDVIERAVGRLPAEHLARVGPSLVASLRARRDRLGDVAEGLYRIVFRYADVHATDVAELATVDRRSDGTVRLVVTVNGADQRVTFDRTFDGTETRELRVYLHGGADEAIVRGSGPTSIKVRVVGGGGGDRLDASGSVGPTRFYDGGDATRVTLGPGARYQRRAAPRPFSWMDGSRTLDWGGSWAPEPRLAYDADRGLVLTAGATVDRYGFLKDPYARQIRVRAGWSLGLSQPHLDYRHYFRDALGTKDLRFVGRWTGMEVINFYGLGNETPLGGRASVHRVIHKQLDLAALVGFGNGVRRHLAVGPSFKYIRTDTTRSDGLLSAVDPYGSGGFAQVGLLTRFEYDRRDRAGTPSQGFAVEGGGAFYPGLLDVDRGAFGEAHGVLSAFVSPVGTNPTLALRAAGKKVWGAYPFAEAAFLGGGGSLRGLHEQRFAGDASLLGSAELRVFVARTLFIVPTDLGVFALTDVGRVFRDGEASSAWHSSYGGGVWLAPLRRSSTVQVSLARASTGRTALYFGVGFAY